MMVHLLVLELLERERPVFDLRERKLG